MIQVVRRSIVDTYNQYSFTRPSLAYDSKGRLYHLHNARYETGKFGQAVMVEEGTTNVLPNPLFNPVWVVDSLNGSTCSVEVVEVGGIPTLHIFDIVQPWTGYPRVRTGNFTTTVTGDITASLRVKSNGAGQLSFNLYDLSFTTKWSQAVYPDTNFRRYTMSSNTTYVLGSGYLMPTAGYEYWVQWPQVEQKPYATSFIDGTRSPELLAILTAGVWNKGNWEQTFSFNPTSPQVVAGKTGYLWELFIDANNYYTLKVGPDGKPYLEVKSNGTIYQTATTSSPAMQVGTWYTLSVRGNGSQMALFVNGSKVSEVSYAEPLGDLPQYMYLGCDHNGANHANGLYDDYRISSRARTDEEIATAYASGQPLPVDADTTLKLDFDGPDGQRAAKVLIA